MASSLPAWTTGAPIPTPREGYGAAEVNGIFYYIAGYGPTGDNTANEAYNPANDTWTTKASLPSSPRSETVAVSDGTFIYLIGGRPVSIVGHDVWRYNPANNTWKSLSSMPTARATEHMAAYYNGNIYVVGGRTTDAPTNGGSLRILEIYHVTTNSWTTGTSLPSGLADAHTALLNEKIYVFGGFTTTGTASTTTYIYDITSDSWTSGASAPAGLVDPAAGVCGPQIYVIGGSTANLGLQNSNYAYNPTTDTWNNSLSIPRATAEVQAISYRGEIFIISGGIFGSGGGNPANQIFHCADNMLYISPSRQAVQPSGSTVTYKVKVGNIQPFNSWNIMVRSNQSVINPQSVSIAGNLFQANFTATVTQLANCVNGAGTGCTSMDGPGIIHSAATVSSTPNATLNGLLFTITYKAVGGTYSPIEILNDNLTRGTCCTVSHFSLNGIYGRPPPNFRLSATPIQSIIGQQSSGVVSIAVTSLENFTGKVNLSGIVSPSGLTLSFAPTIVSVPSNKTSLSQLSISTSGTTSLGNYTITVTATAGSLSHNVRLAISVVPDFSIIAIPDAFVIREGTSVSSTINLISQGFSGTLSLSATVAPTTTNGPVTQLNTTFVFLSPSTSRGVQILIGVFTNTVPGNYAITVTAVGMLTHSTPISIAVLAPSLSLTPSSGTIGTSVTAQGSNFPMFFFQTQASVTVSFDDMFLGSTIMTNGSFTFVLDVPNAQPGPHFVKAQDLSTLAQVNTTFIVLPTPNALTVNVEVGTIYFPGDTTVISILLAQGGTLVGPSAIQLTIQLIKPDGSTIILPATSISAGLFIAKYQIPSAGPIGVYAVKATVHSTGGGDGTGLGSFEVKPTWLSSQGKTITSAVAIVGIVGFAAVAWRKGYLRRKSQDD
ncbi:MAG TPA: kelch repeat-containing protein [Candidatus Bathyarchaeia archaeon]|nr:kelch repeat-containing protein [Candidatus Bathyarchaeia archaeon]